MKKLLIRHLRSVAKRQIERFQPIVVAITGSVGKTSTRNAIAIALGTSLDVRAAKKNYNNEIGVPLAILGEKSAGRNAWEWLKLFRRAGAVQKFPKYLVLEYGADKPGDIKDLCALARPHVAVITAVSPVHAANYPNFAALAEEKATLGDAVPVDGLVVLNGDDQTVGLMRNRFESPTMVYGVHVGDVTARDIRIETRLDEDFEPDEVFAITRATVVAGDERAELELKNAVGEAALLSCLAAVAVARHFGVPLAKAVAALNAEFGPAPGRFRPLAGIKGSLILDDTYNAAPASVLTALETLTLFAPGQEIHRRVVALGKMAELGQYSEAEHRNVGKKVAEVADLFVAVGEEMKAAADEAKKTGMSPDRVVLVRDASEAGRYLDKVIQRGDVVLLKGSQSARMERAVKDIMAEPLRAAELIARQEPEWDS